MTLAIVTHGSHFSSAFLPCIGRYGAFSRLGGRQFSPAVSGLLDSPPYRLRSKTTASNNTQGEKERSNSSSDGEPVPLYRSQGIFAAEKPLGWTSNDVVSHIRGILEREARGRGAKVVSVRSRKNKSRIVRVGHGGTLDPLATGVLVIGVGRGTKEMQGFLKGSKKYTAVGECGFETTTLDMEGSITKTAPFDHVTLESIEGVLPFFLGKTMQIPPIFSAIRKDGKKLYKEAREGKTVDDIEIEAREVEIDTLELINSNQHQIPKFEISMECGGGTYVRSLIRDIGYKLNTVATTTVLTRTKAGQFTLDGSLKKDDWSANNVYAAIDKMNEERAIEVLTENNQI